MSDTPWTPGPWKVDADGMEILSFCDGVDPWGVGIVSEGVGPGADRTEANARLIAAAPDMAEALRLFIEYDAEREADNVQMMLNYADALAAAKAAYAKAKGATT